MEPVLQLLHNIVLLFNCPLKLLFFWLLFKEASSSANNTSVDFTKLFQNAWVLLYETNENIFKSKEPFKTLEEELKTIEKDHRSIGLTSQILIMHLSEMFSNACLLIVLKFKEMKYETGCRNLKKNYAN